MSHIHFTRCESVQLELQLMSYLRPGKITPINTRLNGENSESLCSDGPKTITGTRNGLRAIICIQYDPSPCLEEEHISSDKQFLLKLAKAYSMSRKLHEHEKKTLISLIIMNRECNSTQIHVIYLSIAAIMIPYVFSPWKKVSLFMEKKSMGQGTSSYVLHSSHP